HIQRVAEEHDFCSLAAITSAVPYSVHYLLIRAIERPHGRHIVVGYNPVFATERLCDFSSNQSMVMWLIVVVVEVASFHKVWWIKINQCFVRPLTDVGP